MLVEIVRDERYQPVEQERARCEADGRPPRRPAGPSRYDLFDLGMAWTVNPSLPSTLTAPLFPPSKSPEASR